MILASPPPLHPWPIGAGIRFHPPALNVAVARGEPVGALTCSSGGRGFAVHLELFARRTVVVVPSQIGVGPGGCTYALSTGAPTGVLHVRAGARHTLADLFRVWGRSLRRGRLLSFSGRVSVFVDGVRWSGSPGSVPLTWHRQIVVEVGGYVAPHPAYLFPRGER